MLVWLLLALLIAARYWTSPAPPEEAPPATEEQTAVERVVDGDTILIAGHRRVRLIGVDTPETVKPDHPVEAWGPEASAFTKQFLAGGKARLTFDRERFDQHGRMLAYVWVDDQLLNEELLRAGLARYEHWYRFAEPMKRRFSQAQTEAKQAHRGIWSKRQNPRQSRED